MEKEQHLYRKKPMKKGKKCHWGFTCPNCNEKYSSKNHTEYYLIRWDVIASLTGIYNVDWEDTEFCSKSCLMQYMEKDGPIIDEIYRKIDEFEEEYEESQR